MNSKNTMPNPGGRSTIMCILGCYLCYIGAQIGYGAYKGDESIPIWVSVIFAVFFFLVGVGIIVYGYRCWNEAKKQKEKQGEEESPDTTEIKDHNE